MLNNLQLYRNDVYFNDKETAKVALESQLKASSDGELVISRYAITDENGAIIDVKTLFGIAAVNESGSFPTIYDFEEYVNEKNLNELTINNVVGEWDDTKTAITVVLNATNLNTSDEYVAVSYSGISGYSFNAIEANESIESALGKIEGNFTALLDLIIDNEFVTAHALTKFNESLGLVNGTYVNISDDALLSGSTSFYNADIILSHAIQSQAEKIAHLEKNPPLSGSDSVDIVDGEVKISEDLTLYCEDY